MSRQKAPQKTNAARFLDDLGVTYSMVTFQVDEDDLSAENAAKLLDLPLGMVYKTILLRGQPTCLLEACLPAGTDLDLKALAKAASLRSVSLVPFKELFPLTGYHRGGCSPLGGRRHFPVYLHEAATKLDKMAINAGARGLMLVLDPVDLIEATKATLANIAKPKA
ncbi:MAG: aminoacyl-tRNA deacylase [Deltaproteobacteria bacterium]|jgi:Cys-tRNA(Pro)/Cys-tRNA(Cys) deacylase|nr:aminoacyl-tRNA deacylase [Deltaproteobacteria bacterium]